VASHGWPESHVWCGRGKVPAGSRQAFMCEGPTSAAARTRRWGASARSSAPEIGLLPAAEASRLPEKTDEELLTEPTPSPVAVSASEAIPVAIYADQLWGEGGLGLSYSSRKDIASMGERSEAVITSKLRWDSYFLRESCIYIPAFLSDAKLPVGLASSAASTAKPSVAGETISGTSGSGSTRASARWRPASRPGPSDRPSDRPGLYELLWAELGPHFERSIYKRSKHPAILDLEVLQKSAVYRHVRSCVKERFPGLDIGYSIANLYRDARDVTEFHRDRFMADGNRQFEDFEDQGDEELCQRRRLAHNCTIGISLGAPRSLVFKHLESGQEFKFVQGHGDLFAFTTPVNSTFQHAILSEPVTGPRISLIFWGRVPSEKLC